MTTQETPLDAAVQTVYRTFSRYRAPHGLDARISAVFDAMTNA